MGKLKDKLNKVGKKIERGVNRLGKNIENEAKKISIKKLGKSTENVLKEAAIPIIITVASGGTGAAIATTIAGTAVSRQATKKIKDPVAKAAVGSAITGSFTGSQSLVKDVAKAVVVTKVAKQTKSPAVGVIVGSTLCGEINNINELGKSALKEVAREEVTKVVQKNTNNQYISQGAGILVGAGIDNLYNKLESKVKVQQKGDDKVKIQEKSDDMKPAINTTKNNEKVMSEKFDKERDILGTCNIFGTRQNDVLGDLKFNETSLQSVSNWDSKNVEDKLFNSSNKWDMKKNLNFGNTTVQPASSWDTKDPTLRIKTTFESGDSSVSVFNDFNNLKVSSSKKVNNNLSVGQTASINNKDIRFGLSSKTNGNKYTESGIGYETGKSLSEREVFGYNINRTDIKTDIKGGCVSKQTYNYDIEVPLCGKIGSISQNTLTCSDSITVTDKFGLNSNAAVCGASFTPVGKAITVSGRSVIVAGRAVKESGKVLGTVTIANGVLVAAN